jgi:hypothetical protein
MGVIELLEKAKKGDAASVNEIIKHYEYFIYYEMQKYNIMDMTTCYDCVESNILKAIYKFEI